jgi:hypothetical protein
MTQKNLWETKCTWDTASGTCEEPVYYEITFCNEANALVEGTFCFHHAMELSRDRKYKIYLANKIRKED